MSHKDFVVNFLVKNKRLSQVIILIVKQQSSFSDSNFSWQSIKKRN